MAVSRRDFLKQSGGAFAGMALGPSLIEGQDNSESKQPRNILFLMTDQHRPSALGHIGDLNATTPYLDALAASGTSLQRAYCQVPVCTPSRYSILSGRYMHSHGVLQNGFRPTQELVTFPQLLRQNGFSTACFGKLHIAGRNEVDWDVVDQGTGFRPAELPDQIVLGGVIRGDLSLGQPAPFPIERQREWQAKENSIKFMREHRDEPWFIQCSMHKPHPAFQPPREYWERVDRSKLSISDYPDDDLEDVNPAHLARMQLRNLADLSDDQVLDGMQGYYGNLAFCDAMFGEVLAEVDRLNLREETVIIYASDHGEMLNAHHLWTKFTFFEESVRVPLIFSYPGLVKEDQTSQAMVELIDLFPTITDFLGIDTPESVQGKSIVPVLRGETETHRSYVRSEFLFGRERQTMRMHFDGRSKIIDNGPDVSPELYDLDVDPLEITNIANLDGNRKMVTTLTAELRDWGTQDVMIGLRRRRGGGVE